MISMGIVFKKNQTTYRYDALNRLIAIDDHTYTYDPFGRLIESQGENYLYLNDLEIGTLDCLRITYSGRTIAIEMNGIPYQTTQNHRGDIVTLIDSSGKAVTTYKYTAFGEATQDGEAKSPWQFTAQRYDANERGRT